jgi:hypothetical protein
MLASFLKRHSWPRVRARVPNPLMFSPRHSSVSKASVLIDLEIFPILAADCAQSKIRSTMDLALILPHRRSTGDILLRW